MATSRCPWRHFLSMAAAIISGVACQAPPSAPSLLPTAPSRGAQEWSRTAVQPLAPASLGACFSATSPACFTDVRIQSLIVGAEPGIGPPDQPDGQCKRHDGHIGVDAACLPGSASDQLRD